MLQFIFCLFGLHGVTEIDYTADDEEITNRTGFVGESIF